MSSKFRSNTEERRISPIRYIVVGGRKSSISVEDTFWDGLKQIAAERKCNVQELIANIKQTGRGNLSSKTRVFVLEYFREKAANK